MNWSALNMNWSTLLDADNAMHIANKSTVLYCCRKCTFTLFSQTCVIDAENAQANARYVVKKYTNAPT